jgi:carbamoyltransferase
VTDGAVVAAAQEERFTRQKFDASFPANAARYCLRAAGLRPADIDYVVFYDKPFLKFERLFETYLAFAPRGFRSFATSMPLWLKDKLFQKNLLADALRAHLDASIDWAARLRFSEHHLSHAASAFFPSPFRHAAVLTLDGVGEWTTTALAVGEEQRLSILKEIRFPHSLGLLYSAFTFYTGFKVNSGEYKLMGLAPYGEPRYAGLIRDHLIDIKDDGSFHLDLDYFDYCSGLSMTNERFAALFAGAPRVPEGAITQREMDLAASVQAVTEEVVLKLAEHVHAATGLRHLCLAGGVALNCVANGKLLRRQIFDDVWIQPAAGDAGGALGAALAGYHLMCNSPRSVPDVDLMQGGFLGPEFAQPEIVRRLEKLGAVFRTLPENELLDSVAAALADGKAVGWYQGRMEFGPRALGARSILADPRSPTVQRELNLKVKFRESFRPFAPSVLREDLTDWFDIDVDSPYMLFTADVAAAKRLPLADARRDASGIAKLSVVRSEIPAVTHVDYSARVQTVHARTNPRYHCLLSRFKERTGCPVLVNTSFNVRGEPIVCTPEDAFRCFMGSDIEVLAAGDCILHKEDQDRSRHGARQTYALD